MVSQSLDCSLCVHSLDFHIGSGKEEMSLAQTLGEIRNILSQTVQILIYIDFCEKVNEGHNVEGELL